MMTMIDRRSDDPPPTELRRAFSAYPTGVMAMCALVEDAPVGMAVNSFTSISLQPPLAAVSVARTSTTWPLLSERRVGLSALSATQEALCRQLSSPLGDRFAGADWHANGDGAVFIAGAALWLECDVRAIFDGGDHEIVVMRVFSAQPFPDVDPLVFHQSRFHAIQGSAEATAVQAEPGPTGHPSVGDDKEQTQSGR